MSKRTQKSLPKVKQFENAAEGDPIPRPGAFKPVFSTVAPFGFSFDMKVLQASINDVCEKMELTRPDRVAISAAGLLLIAKSLVRKYPTETNVYRFVEDLDPRVPEPLALGLSQFGPVRDETEQVSVELISPFATVTSLLRAAVNVGHVGKLSGMASLMLPVFPGDPNVQMRMARVLSEAYLSGVSTEMQLFEAISSGSYEPWLLSRLSDAIGVDPDVVKYGLDVKDENYFSTLVSFLPSGLRESLGLRGQVTDVVTWNMDMSLDPDVLYRVAKATETIHPRVKKHRYRMVGYSFMEGIPPSIGQCSRGSGSVFVFPFEPRSLVTYYDFPCAAIMFFSDGDTWGCVVDVKNRHPTQRGKKKYWY